MAYDFSGFNTRVGEITTWLQKELGSIRAGIATPSLLDGVMVESYGSKVPINQVGTVGVEDAKTLHIGVWDKGQAAAVEKAILDANLGLSVVSNISGLRVVFPELTGERREQLLKLAKNKFEEGRVQLRGARDDAMRKLEAEKLSEDETFRAKEDLQKNMETANQELQNLFDAKEKEIKG